MQDEMRKKIRVSVIMTTYNGDRFVKEQVLSILKNLEENDELLISDDGSSDNTIPLLCELQNDDKRIKVFHGPRKGLNENIKFLYSQAKGTYIFISDQDDVWHDDKVSTILDEFCRNPNLLVIHHDSNLVDSNGDKISEKSVYETISFSISLVKFILKSHCFGSMMAFRRELLDYKIIPNKNCYDAGLMCYALRMKKIKFIDDILMDYRRHDSNVSTFRRRKMIVIIKERIHLIFYIIKNVLWKKKVKKNE